MAEQAKPNLGVRAGSFKLERREHQRFATILEASCSLLAAREKAFTVRVSNVSANGLGLLSMRRFERGTMLLIQIQQDSQAVAPVVVGKVVHVTAQASGEWLIGCALARDLTNAEVQALAEDGPKPA